MLAFGTDFAMKQFYVSNMLYSYADVIPHKKPRPKMAEAFEVFIH